MSAQLARQQDADAPRNPGAEPLLPQQQPEQRPPPPAVGLRRRRRTVPWLTILGFAFLTLNSGMAIYRSRGERGAVAFVSFSYVDLLLLFACLRWYENAEPDSATRRWLKAAVWVLTTALTILFSAKVAAVMPPAVAVVVWLMAFCTVAGGFYAFFCYKEKT